MAKLNNLTLHRPMVFFDLEATGVNPQVDRIVEICVAKLHPGGEYEVKSRRINPERPIPAEATAIHGITDADVANAPTFKSYSASLNLYLEDCDLAGYNILRYDLPLLKAEFKRVDMDFSLDNRRLLDAQVIFHQKEPRTLSAAFKFYCGKEHEDAHSAESDVLATIAVLDGELARYQDLPRDVAALHDFCKPKDANWIDESGRFKWDGSGESVVGFGKNQGLTLREVAATNPGFLSWMIKSDFADDAKKIAKDALVGKFPIRGAKNGK